MIKVKQKYTGKLLDHWEAPEEAGKAIGLISTTFTLQSDFFEEQCLARFLQMETDPVEDGGLYILEQEEKLHGLQCAAVWVDQLHAKQKRNLRWDLLPFRLHSAILHAKITCLLWANHARIMLGSANLTKEGYRVNQELMIVLDWNEFNPGDRDTGLVFMDYLSELLSNHQQSDLPVTKRSKDFLAEFKSRVKKWGTPTKHIRHHGYRLFPLFTSFTAKSSVNSLLIKSKQIWENEASKILPDACFITSPFFDQQDSSVVNASTHILETLKQKGQVELHYLSNGEWDSANRTVQLIYIPSFIRDQKRPENVKLSIQCIQEYLKQPDSSYVIRPLHAKTIWWESEEGWILYLIGSSNFTAKGLGLSTRSNYEANIGILTNRKRYKEAFLRLENSFTYGKEVDINSVKWKAQPPEDDVSQENGFTPLHPFFQTASLVNESGIQLKLCFSSAISPPELFEIAIETGIKVFDNLHWRRQGSPATVVIPFNPPALPSGFIVTWGPMKKTGWLTLNIETQDALLPPEDLRNLSFDVLARVLTSAKPLHTVLRSLLKRNERAFAGSIEKELDPHQRVNTSSFLLKRINRYSKAIDQLKTKLELPTITIGSLDWQINGPVGLMAIWKALQKEAKTIDEELFFLSELIIMIDSVKPQTKSNYLPVRIVSKQLDKVKSDLIIRLKQRLKEVKASPMKLYAKKVLNKSA